MDPQEAKAAATRLFPKKEKAGIISRYQGTILPSSNISQKHGFRQAKFPAEPL
jgi:hypothetical protein